MAYFIATCLDNPAKRANIGGMDGSGLVQMGGPGMAGQFIGGLGVGGNQDNIIEVISIPDNTVGLGMFLPIIVFKNRPSIMELINFIFLPKL